MLVLTYNSIVQPPLETKRYPFLFFILVMAENASIASTVNQFFYVIFNYKFTKLCPLITKTLYYNYILSQRSPSFHTVRNISELYEP